MPEGVMALSFLAADLLSDEITTSIENLFSQDGDSCYGVWR
jgi:hypothetical protein